MSQPLWKRISGKFAGWRRNDYLFDADGKCVGFFDGDDAFSIRDGTYLGEIVDVDYIGKRTSSIKGTRLPRIASIDMSAIRHIDRLGSNVLGYVDPDL